MAEDPQESPIGKEASLEKVLYMLKERMKQGKTFVAPQRIMAGDKFVGMQLIVIDPITPGEVGKVEMKIRLVVQIFVQTKTIEAQTEQNFIAYAIQAIAVAEFLEETKAARTAEEEVDKAITGAADKIEKFPTPPAKA